MTKPKSIEVLNWFYLGDESKYTPEAWANHKAKANAQMYALTIEAIGEDYEIDPTMLYVLQAEKLAINKALDKARKRAAKLFGMEEK